MDNDKTKDRELQKWIFGDESADYYKPDTGREDVELYRMIGDELRKEPEFFLGQNFAEQTTRKAIKRKKLQLAYKLILSYSLIVLLLMSAGGLVFYFLAKDVYRELITLLSGYGVQIILVITLIAGIQLVDKLFIRKETNMGVFD